MSHYLIGVDVGTQSVKAVVFLETGERISAYSKALSLRYPFRNAVEQDPNEIYDAVIASVRCAVEQADIPIDRIAAVGLDSQMAGIMGVDKNMEAITAYDSWLDHRCQGDADRMRLDAEREIVFSTGGQIGNAHAAKILWHKRENQSTYRKISRFVTLNTYLVGRLCGLRAEAAYIDDTHLHFTGFANTEQRTWNRDLLAHFGVDADKMPLIKRSHEIVGRITKEAADLSGLLQGTPVVAGCGDTAASVLGAGITEPGYSYDVAGTASVFAGCTDHFSPDVEHGTLNYMRSPIEGLWTPLAYINGGGLCLRWFRDLCRKSYGDLDALAEQVEAGCGGLTFVPHFSGRCFPSDSSVKGAFIGLNQNHTTGHLYRAIMEAIAYEYGIYHRILMKKDPDTAARCVLGVGGGAGSRIFNQIKADVLNIPYARLQFEDTAPYGAAVLAGYGCGLFENLSEAATRNRHVCDPLTPQKQDAYKKSSEQYERILKNFGALFSEENEVIK